MREYVVVAVVLLYLVPFCPVSAEQPVNVGLLRLPM